MVQTSPIIILKELEKKFDDQIAVNKISLQIPTGIVFSLLGPNGAGKSTTIRMISCTLEPSSGSITILGRPSKRNEFWVKSRLGIVPQTSNIDPDFSVRENLEIYAYYHRIPKTISKERIDGLLHFVRLESQANKNADDLSGGMKRRLILARALLNDPEILILDEPTTGLDVQARYAIWDMIRELRAKGKTVVLTTHYMAEAEALSDYVAIMDHGNIIAQGTIADLRSKVSNGDVLEIEGDISPYIRSLLDDIGKIELVDGKILAYVPDWKESLKKIGVAINEFPSLRIRSTTLEDVFVSLTGRELRD